MTQKILVMGSTGRVGHELVLKLAEDGIAVRAATRNPEKINRKGFPANVQAVEVDYEKPKTFALALAGVEKLFLVVRPGDNSSDKVAIPLVDEAKKAKVRHIVTLTAMGVEQDESFMLRILEKHIEDTGVPYTHLRPNWFMQGFDSGPLYDGIIANKAIHLPAGDGQISFIDVRDLATVAYCVLVQPGHLNKAYTLTGGEALNYHQAAEKISMASGEKISYVTISEEVFTIALKKKGVSDDLIQRWIFFYRRVRQGSCALITHDVETIIGRLPISFDQYVSDHSSAWKHGVGPMKT